MKEFSKVDIQFTPEQIRVMEELMSKTGHSKLRTWIREACIRAHIEGQGIAFPPSVQVGGYRPRKSKPKQ
jgi:hypothetical protein